MEAVRTNQMRTIEIPAKWWPADEEMYMNKIGSTIIIMPKSKVRDEMRAAVEAFSDDLFEDGRPEQRATSREEV